MANENLTCSILECKKRLLDVNKMSFAELEKYNKRCGECGNWILKDSAIANKTYHAVSSKWAEEFMNNIMKKGSK